MLPRTSFQSFAGVVLLDLGQLVIKSIPTEFCLACPDLEHVILPPQLETIGLGAFLSCPKLKKLSQPCLMKSTAITLVPTSPTVGIGTEIVARFLSGSAVEYLPFVRLVSKVVSPTANGPETDEQPTLHQRGGEQLQPRHSLAESEQADFFQGSFFRSVERIGECFLSKCKYLKCVDFIEAGVAKLTRIGDDFLIGSSVASIVLNPQIKYIGSNFASSCVNLCRIDLSHCRLTCVGDNFLRKAVQLEEIVLPYTLSTIREGFLLGCVALKVLDLFHTSVVYIGSRFLVESGVRRLRFPTSLKTFPAEDLASLEFLEVLSSEASVQSPSLRRLRPSLSLVTPQQWEETGPSS
jgi:hypothetical protein